MDRRAFLGHLALGALALPRAALAQPARKVYRIGILSLRATSDLVGPQPRSPSTNALLHGLRAARRAIPRSPAAGRRDGAAPLR